MALHDYLVRQEEHWSHPAAGHLAAYLDVASAAPQRARL